MSDFVTLKKCFSQIEAHQLKNMLDNEGIFSQLMNETISQVYNFHAPSDGGVLLKVHRKDIEAANAILDSNVRLDLLTENLWDKEPTLEGSVVNPKTSSKSWYLYTLLLILVALAIIAALIS